MEHDTKLSAISEPFLLTCELDNHSNETAVKALKFDKHSRMSLPMSRYNRPDVSGPQIRSIR